MKSLLYIPLIFILITGCNNSEKNESEVEKSETVEKPKQKETECGYEIKRLFTAPPVASLNITSGYRLCDGEIISNEVIVFMPDEALGDKESNVYVSEDLRPIEIKWKDSTLIISHYFDPEPSLQADTVYGFKVIYNDLGNTEIQ